MSGRPGKILSAALGYADLLLRWPLRAQTDPALPPKRMLVLGYAAIGDFIFFLPTLQALRATHPQAKITFLADRYGVTEELLPASKLVDDIWLYEHSQLARRSGRAEISERIRAAGFDAVVVSHATPMDAFASAILDIPLRIGHRRPLVAPHEGWSGPRYGLWKLRRGVISGEFERKLALNRPIRLAEGREHAVIRNLRLLEPLGGAALVPPASRPTLPEPDGARAFAERALAGGGPERLVGLHLGAAGTPRDPYRKIWPAERWAAVCREMVRAHPCRLVVLGGPGEADAVKRFAAAYSGPFIDLVGRASLLESVAVTRRCQAFLGGDTGPVKAAMALGVPTFSVWGPTSRLDNGAFWDPERHAEVQLSLPCQPCAQMALPNEGSGVINFLDCGHHDCLNRLTTETVQEALDRWLSSQA